MTYLIYDNTFEGLLTAVFEVYDRKIDKTFLCNEEFEIPQLFNDQLRIAFDEVKSERVWNKLIKIIGTEKSKNLWKAWLSELPDIENVIFRTIQYLLKENQDILNDYTNADVLKLHQTLKMIGREKHRMEAFVRFELTKDNLYYSTIEPDFNVLPLLITHFQSRYADQKWLIYDLKREYGIYYDLEKTEFIDFQDNTRLKNLNAEILNECEVKYQVLWQDYFSSANIPARKNTKLHLRHIPKRYWKYLTEKKYNYFRDFITLAGFPTARESDGIFFVTTAPAPITQRSPMVTPGQITAAPPIQQSSPIMIGFPDS